MGLFLGISFLSLCELFELLFDLIIINIFKKLINLCKL